LTYKINGVIALIAMIAKDPNDAISELAIDVNSLSGATAEDKKASAVLLI
jgi:hypothetical protein